MAEAITKGIQLLEETKGRSSFEVKILREKLNFEAEQALSLFFFAHERELGLGFV